MFKPMPGTAVVKKVEEKERKTKGGILISEQTAERQQHAIGEVIEAAEYIFSGGTERHPLQKIPMEVKKGDKIIFEPTSVRDVRYKGIKYYFVNERDIYAKVIG